MMKNYLLALAIIAMPFFYACSDDDPVNPPVGNPELGIRAQPSTFDIYGGTATLEVVTKDLDKEWKISTDNSWIILGEPNYDNNTFTVTVKGAENAEETKGTIKLSAESVETVEIPITQAGLGAYLNRNTRQLMNLKGKVKSMDSHVMIKLRDYMAGIMEFKLKDISFNEDGMATAISFPYSQYTSTISDITYDSHNRLKTYKYFDGAFGRTFESELSYNSGEYYITTEEFFHITIGENHMGVESKAWMPTMLKGFSEFKTTPFVFNTAEYPSAICRLREEENVMNMYLSVYDEDGDLMEEDPFPWNSYYMENGYTKQAVYPSSLGPAFMVQQINTYDVDYETGMIQRYENSYFMWGDPSEITETWFYSENTLNRLNTVSTIFFIQSDSETEEPIMIPCNFVYNGYLDPVRIENYNASGVDYDISYVYDAQGNWTKMTIVKTGSETGEETYTRTITYYE